MLTEHRLAAIMFTDIVGYSALMQQDKNQAQAQARLHEMVIQIHAEKYRGTVEQFYGDGSLCTFQSTTDAVKCARDIQLYLQNNSYVPLRIGLHIGDIVREDSKIYGDGINIASRIESSGHAGSVLLSKHVYDKIRNDPSLQARALGKFQFKNIREPMHLYALVDEQLPPFNIDMLSNRTKSRGGISSIFGAPITLYVLNLLVGFLAGYFILQMSQKSKELTHQVVRATIPLDDDKNMIYQPYSAPMSISDDGSKIVYVGQSAKSHQLYIRHLDNEEITTLPGTEGARHPAFSPDGNSICFFAENKLKRLNLRGGSPIELSHVVGHPHGVDWTPEGEIVYCMGDTSLWTMSAAGGTPRQIHVTVDYEELLARRLDTIRMPVRFPRYLTENFVLIHVGWLEQGAYLGILDMTSGKLDPLLEGIQGQYVDPGYLIFGSNPGDVSVIRFDLKSRKVVGSSAKILSDVFLGNSAGKINFAYADNGTLIFTKGGFERQIYLLDQIGRGRLLDVAPRGYRIPKVSPDGSKIALTVDPRPSQIWIYDFDQNSIVPITSDGHNLGGIWDWKSERVIFRSRGDLMWSSAVEGYQLNHIDMTGSPRGYPQEWSRSDEVLYYVPRGDIGAIFAMNITDGKIRELFNSDEHVTYTALSPNEEWLAYSSDLTGSPQIFITTYPRPGQAIRLTKNGGLEPHWSKDGNVIYYRWGNSIMAINVTDINSPEEPRELFTSDFGFGRDENWDVLPSGEFVMVKEDLSTTNQIQVIQNFHIQMERLLD